jgi:hypothetical protein
MADPEPLPPLAEGRLDTAGGSGSGACLGFAGRPWGRARKLSVQSLRAS